MQDKIEYSGYFKINVIDINGNVEDSYEDNNKIMDSAREVMSKLFFKYGNSINKIVLGTLGHNGELNILKKDSNGFISARDRLFSEYKIVGNETIYAIKNDIILYSGDSKFYQYFGSNGETSVNYSSVLDTSTWKETIEPYSYWITFDMPDTFTINGDEISGTCTVTDERGVADGEITSPESTMTVTMVDGTAKFNLVMSANVAQGISQTYRIFTESALYSDLNIFSMKVFPVKYKNNSSQVQIEWSIAF